MIADDDLRGEFQVEDIQNILNVGEIIGLFTDEDMEEINYELEKQLRATKQKGKPFEIFM